MLVGDARDHTDLARLDLRLHQCVRGRREGSQERAQVATVVPNSVQGSRHLGSRKIVKLCASKVQKATVKIVSVLASFFFFRENLTKLII